VSCHGNQINVIVLQYVAALASQGLKRKTKAMSVHCTSISLSRCVINFENMKRSTPVEMTNPISAPYINNINGTLLIKRIRFIVLG
jgi:hypothetical protein